MHKRHERFFADGMYDPRQNEIDEETTRVILSAVLFRFPVNEIGISLPGWVNDLDTEHWLRKSICNCVRECSCGISCVGDAGLVVKGICDNEYINSAQISKLDLGKGCAEIEAVLSGELIYKIIEDYYIIDR